MFRRTPAQPAFPRRQAPDTPPTVSVSFEAGVPIAVDGAQRKVSGIICKLAGDALAKTGVVKSYAIGSAVRAGRVYTEED